jgi:hypothetical protein
MVVVHGRIPWGKVEFASLVIRHFLIEAQFGLDQSTGRVSGFGEGIHKLVSRPLTPELLILALIPSLSIPVLGQTIRFGNDGGAVGKVESAVARGRGVLRDAGFVAIPPRACEPSLTRVFATGLLGLT